MDGVDRTDTDWRSLCEQASKEKDPEKLMELVRKLNQALEEHRRRGNGAYETHPPARQSSSDATWTMLVIEGS